MSLLVERLGWTLIHSLWEGALIWLALRLALSALRRRSAQARYLAGCAALVAAILAPSITFLRLSAGVASEGFSATAAKVVLQQRTSIASEAGLISSALRQGFVNFEYDLQAAIPWLVLLWAVGCSLASFRLACDWKGTRRVSIAPHRPLPVAIRQRCGVLAARLGINRAVQFGESLLVEVPLVVGWLKPTILVPVGAFMGLTSDQIDAVLGHELAHVLRHDFPVNLLQSVCDVLFFYHPAVLAINRGIRLERENACDDIAVKLTGDPLGYAAALARLEETRHPVLSLAATGTGDLIGRIRRLIGRPPLRERSFPALTWVAIAGVCFYFSTLLVPPTVVAPLHASGQAERPVHSVAGSTEVIRPKSVVGPPVSGETIGQNSSPSKHAVEKRLEIVIAHPSMPLPSTAPKAKATAAIGRPTALTVAETRPTPKDAPRPATIASSSKGTTQAIFVQPRAAMVSLSREVKSSISEEADQIPVPASGVGPLYPFDMLRRGIGGEVMVDFIVETDGSVRNAHALNSTRWEFEDTAVRAVSHWTFTPGKSHGHLVVEHLRIPILFTYNDVGDDRGPVRMIEVGPKQFLAGY